MKKRPTNWLRRKPRAVVEATDVGPVKVMRAVSSRASAPGAYTRPWQDSR